MKVNMPIKIALLLLIIIAIIVLPILITIAVGLVLILITKTPNKLKSLTIRLLKAFKEWCLKNSVINFILTILIFITALTFWDLWCLLISDIDSVTGGINPESYRKLSPLWHLRNFFK